MTEYLRALQPITTPQQYEKTEKIVKQFLVNPGPKIHQYLVEKREAEENWVSWLMKSSKIYPEILKTFFAKNLS
jgi:hypothetical protein